MEIEYKKANLKLPCSFILASGSPRRKELLSRLIPDFEVIPSTVEEIKFHQDGPVSLVSENSLIKAKDISREHPESLVLGADTLVFLDRKPFGKPGSRIKAVEMLKELSGREHIVATGVSLIWEEKDFELTFTDETRVLFKELSSQIIKEYFDHIDPLDKAGAYAIQTCSEMIIEKWEGSLCNVVGLPLEKLEEKLSAIFC